MRIPTCSVLCVVSVVSLSGCTDSAGKPSAAVDQRIDALEQSVQKLQQAQSFDELLDVMRKTAFLRPGDTGYSLVDFDLGRLTVQMTDVSAFANGTRVMLRFGNMSAAGLSGVSASVDYGPTDDKGNVIPDKTRTKEVKFVEIFRPGSWVSVAVTLDGIQPAQLGYVRVSKIAHTGIQLSGR